MLSPSGVLVLQTSVATHAGVALTRALTARRYARRNGYALSYFTLEAVAAAAAAAGLTVRETRRYGLGLPFGDALWPRMYYWLERSTHAFASRAGAEAIVVLKRPL
jgi:hypothetical protein